MAQNPNNLTFSGAEKASILMMSLDEEVSSKLFAQMTEEEIRQISQTMSRLGKISQDNIEDLMKEFSEELGTGKSVVGDMSNAKKILTKALGADKVESIIGDMGGPMGKDTWDRLNNVGSELLASFIKNEHPQTAALILSKTSASKTSEVLAILPQDFSLNIIRRMIAMEPVKREVLTNIENILQNEFMTTLSAQQKTDTIETIAEIFNNFDRATESKFFELLDKDDPEVSEKIRELMFTFDDLIKIDAAGIQAVIRGADKDKMPIALKGANDEIKKLFFDNMSERAAKILKEDMESLGPVRISDVDEAQLAMVQTAKLLAESGEIIIPEGGDDEEEQMIY